REGQRERVGPGTWIMALHPFAESPRMKRFALAGIVCAGMIVSAQAGTLDDIKKRGAIRFGYSETSVPFSWKKAEGGEVAGYSVEICKRVAAGVAQQLKIAD